MAVQLAKQDQNSIRVAIIGSGNWGSAIAKVIGNNVQKCNEFDKIVPMYVYEEMIDNKKLTEIINETHENVKYLPGYKLPENVVAVPDIGETVKAADILVFVLPHQFVKATCNLLKGKTMPKVTGLSLIKGFHCTEDGDIVPISQLIKNELNVEVSVLMGANLAGEVAAECFCEATIGCKDPKMALIYKRLIETDYFRVVSVPEVLSVELCGALKNIVACAAGFSDGLKFGGNTKAAIIRLGLMEMIKFIKTFFENTNLSTFLESCGVADLITTCYGGRNRRLSEEFVKTGKTFKELEKELLNGQLLQGPPTAHEVYIMLKKNNKTDMFPIFTAVHQICVGDLKANAIISALENHPEHSDLDPVEEISSLKQFMLNELSPIERIKFVVPPRILKPVMVDNGVKIIIEKQNGEINELFLTFKEYYLALTKKKILNDIDKDTFKACEIIRKIYDNNTEKDESNDSDEI